MIKIRLTRLGGTHDPYYRVVVADARTPRDGKIIDMLGTYNPLKQPHEVKIDLVKAKEWIAKGAKPTDTVRDLLKQVGFSDAKTKKAVVKKAVKPASAKPEAKSTAKTASTKKEGK